MAQTSGNYKALAYINNQTVERFIKEHRETTDLVRIIVRAGKGRKKKDVEFQIALWHFCKLWMPRWEHSPPRGIRTKDGMILTSWYMFRVWLASRVLESPNTLDNYYHRIEHMRNAGMEWPAIINMLAKAPTHIEMLVTQKGKVKITLPEGQTLSQFVVEELSPLANPHEIGERIRQETGAPTFRFHDPVKDSADGGLYFSVTLGWREKTDDGLGDREMLEEYKFKVSPVNALSKDKRAMQEIRDRLRIGTRSVTEREDGG